VQPYRNEVEVGNGIKKSGVSREEIFITSKLWNNQTGEPRTVDDAVVHEVAKQVGLDAGVCLVSWAIQRGTLPLPKSVTPSRIASNLQVKHLPEDAYARLSSLERHKRFNFPARWGYDIFEEVGEDAVREIGVAEGPNNLVKFTI
jgi:diketogulonate reductase-like aldo/keto reductase